MAGMKLGRKEVNMEGEGSYGSLRGRSSTSTSSASKCTR